jgi:stage V sporulation protein S
MQVRVSSSSSPNAVSAALARAVLAGEQCTVSAIGAAAVNQAMKAAAVARVELATHGLALLLAPGFEPVTIDGERRVSLVFAVVTTPLAAAITPQPAAASSAASSAAAFSTRAAAARVSSTVAPDVMIDLTDAAMAANDGQPIIDVRRPRVHLSAIETTES